MDWLTVLPQIVAIGIVIWRKEVILALIAGIFTSEVLILIQNDHNASVMGFIGTIDRIVNVFSSPNDTKVLMFSLLIGALLAFLRYSGGVSALVELLIKKGMTKTKKQAGLLTFFVGIVLFIEANLSILTAGILSRGLFDRFGMSRERLAYVIDSTSSPVCILILVNGWGAVILSNLSASGLEDPVNTMIGSIGYNFYAWIALSLTLYTILSDKIHGPLKDCEIRSNQVSQKSSEHPPSKVRYMTFPLIVLISSTFGVMYWTGNGNISAGNASSSILYATVLAIVISYVMMLSSGRFSHIQLVDIAFKGMSELLQLVSIVLLSLALGASLKILGTGIFIAGIAGETLPLIMIVPMLFIAGSITSFATGTSWGTFAILIPIGVPIIQQLGLPPAFVLSAILGGGIFGDHCSPISDSTVVSSVAAGCDLLDHVRTQMPYALVGGGATFIIYIVVGMVIL